MKNHLGVVLEPSVSDFDAGAATWGCAFTDDEDPGTTYLYYSGAADHSWTHASIGLAASRDGKHFKKLSDLNPVIDGKNREFNSWYSITPAVVRFGNYYYMFFAADRKSIIPVHRNGIAIAYAGDPRGPWKPRGLIATPEFGWEGLSIEPGPGVANLGEGQFLVYYSNASSKLPVDLRFPILPRFIRRHVGILNVTIRSPNSITAQKFPGNPLMHLNGPRGSPAESLYCPGYLSFRGRHILLPSMSTYSVGYPFRQYIGIVSDTSPFFMSGTVRVLLDGPVERREVMNPKGQIALDTPSTVCRNEEVYLYYSAMDRHDRIWKMALSVIDIQAFDKMASENKGHGPSVAHRSRFSSRIMSASCRSLD